jgi:hypothetical protein
VGDPAAVGAWLQLGQAFKAMKARSSVLSPLLWLVAILVFLLIALVIAGAALWLQVGVFIILLVAAAKALLWYDHFAVKDPVQLCSEGFRIEDKKLGLLGDSQSGMRRVDLDPTTPNIGQSIDPPKRLEGPDGK